MKPSAKLPRLSRISLLVFFLLSIVTTAQSMHVSARQASTCGGKPDLQQCGAGYPSDFCCPASTRCMNLDSTDVQSVICCPTGSDCGIIQTITCDVTQLNATLHPDNQMHLSDTTGVKLHTCGSNCCPLGYKCQSNMCFKDTSPSSSPTSASPTPSATKPASASQTSSCPVAPVQTSSGFNGSSFAAGFFPGIIIGAVGTIGLIWVIKKRRESQSKERFSGDFGHVARQISDPIYDPRHAARTDFMRRGSRSAQPSPNSASDLVYNDKSDHPPAHGLTPRIKSMWNRTPKLNFGFSSGLPAHSAPPPPTIRAGNSQDPYTTPRQTPRRKHKSHRSSRSHHRPELARTGSTETIDVLMPAPSFLEPPKAHGMRENRFTSDTTNTTFTKLMERAGFDDEGRKEVRNYSSPNPRRI
jgi:hypothetical protein